MFTLVQPSMVVGAGLSGAAAGMLAVFLWHRRRLARKLQFTEAWFRLCEDVLNAGSLQALAELLGQGLPGLRRATQATLYLYQRDTRCLERVPTAANQEPMAAPVEAPPEGLGNAAVACFLEGAHLNIPDCWRHPVTAGGKRELPRAALFVPVGSRTDALGVLEIADHDDPGYFDPGDVAAAQHLAAQIAAALRLHAAQPVWDPQRPARGRAVEPGSATPKTRTWLLVAPEKDQAVHWMRLLHSRGQRVVPTRPGEAVDLAQRLRFDAALWTVAAGAGWNDFRERVRALVPVFFAGGNFAQTEVDRILYDLDAREHASLPL